MNKIIIIFLVIFLLFGAVVIYQFAVNNAPKSKVTIDGHSFSVRVATTSAQQQQGLSGEKNLPQDQGMLFLFKTKERYAFWMKGMQFPLDIIFIKDNKIDTIIQNIKPPAGNTTNLPIYQPDHAVDKVIEINAGLAKKYNFKKNDDVKIELQKNLQNAL